MGKEMGKKRKGIGKKKRRRPVGVAETQENPMDMRFYGDFFCKRRGRKSRCVCEIVVTIPHNPRPATPLFTDP